MSVRTRKPITIVPGVRSASAASMLHRTVVVARVLTRPWRWIASRRIWPDPGARPMHRVLPEDIPTTQRHPQPKPVHEDSLPAEHPSPRTKREAEQQQKAFFHGVITAHTHATHCMRLEQDFGIYTFGPNGGDGMTARLSHRAVERLATEKYPVPAALARIPD